MDRWISPLRDTYWNCRRSVWATDRYSPNCACPNNRLSEAECDQDLWQELKEIQDNTPSHGKKIPPFCQAQAKSKQSIRLNHWVGPG